MTVSFGERRSALPLVRKVLLRTTALVAASIPAMAYAQELPTGGNIVVGAGTIQQAGPQLTVTTTTQRTVVDWNSFSIGADSKVRIDQPNASSINVNRVIGTDPSKIFGVLESNGRVVLANPNGIWFGPSARVDVAGIVASAGQLSNANLGEFASGGALRLTAGNLDASVINQGSITVAEGGLAALVAPGVRNSGVINARLGHVQLGAGVTSTLDFYGDGLINLAIGGTVTSPTMGADGTALDAAVRNSGRIYADGGSVTLSANVAEGVLNNVINMDGVIQARGVSTAGGVVELLGGNGSVAVSGTVDVTGRNGNAGGRIAVQAGNAANNADGVLNLTGKLDASSEGGKGGSVSADARFAYLGGEIHADGATGGSAAVHAAGVTQAGAVTANATSGNAGTVQVAGRLNVTQTLSAVTSASSTGGNGGSVTVKADAGRVFSSGTMTATGTTGGAVDVLASDIALAAAKLDASGSAGNGGAIRVGGDLHGEGVSTAKTVFVNAATTLNAKAGTNGQGGKVVVWSDEKTDYQGSAVARGGSVSGDGGMIEVSSKGLLTFSGAGDAGATSGKAGTLLLDPKNIVIDDAAGGLAVFDLVDPNSGSGSSFGLMAVQQSNGTIVVTKPLDDVAGASAAGSVYFYDSTNGGLISAFQGTNVNDSVGLGNNGDSQYGGSGVMFLNNANYLDGTKAFLLVSPNWNGNRGAVTWVGANQTIGGVVSSSNSLVGGTANDYVGSYQNSTSIDVLNNGNYVIRSPDWGGGKGAISFAGAATGSTGVVGATNSIVGSITAATNGNGRKGDALGSSGIFQLTNGNFLVLSPDWNRQGGAVTFGNGTTGLGAVGVLSSANSLVAARGGTLYSAANTRSGGNNYGFYGADHIGSGSVRELANGDYVVLSAGWDHGKGAITLGSGATGLVGAVGSSNSLVGVTAGTGDTSDGTYNYFTTAYGVRDYYGGDAVGSGGITELGNGAWTIASPSWGTNKGAVTYVAAGTTSLSGTITASNSLTGTTAGIFNSYDGDHRGTIFNGDQVGGVTALANHNYVVTTRYWDSFKGAVTVMDGTTGFAVTGSNGSKGDTVSASNSLIGSTNGDYVGNSITLLSGTSDFIASSYFWGSGKGQVTRVSGTSGLAATVSASNSLVGTTSYEWGFLGGDEIGGGGIKALANGAWVILSPNWNKTRGAVTFVTSGNTITGNVSASNSLVGATGAIGNAMYCNTCNIGGGAIFGGDQLGSGGITTLANGNFLVLSPYWTGAKGAVTYVNGTTGALVDGTGSLRGTISSANSLVGSQGGTVYTSAKNVNGLNYVGVKYYVGGDRLGSSETTPIQLLSNGNFLVMNSHWSNDTGAVTFGTANGKFGDGTTFAGVVSSGNSLVGSTASTLKVPGNTTTDDYTLNGNGDRIGKSSSIVLSNGNYLLFNDNWSGTRGAITWGSGTTGVKGVLSSGNSLVGSTVGDQVGTQGDYFTTVLPDGSLVFVNYAWGGYAGAVTHAASTGPVTGVISAANSFVGNPGDQVGAGGIVVLAGGDYVISSYNYDPGSSTVGGAVTWSGALGNSLTGTLGSTNSFYDNPLVPYGYMYSTKLNDASSFLMNFAYNDSGRVVLGFTDPTRWTYARAPQATLTIAPSLIANALNSGTSLVLQANNDITLNSAIATNANSSANLTLAAGRSIIGHGDISLGNGALTLLANDSVAHGVVDAYRDAGAANIAFDAGTTIAAGTVDITLATSADKTHNTIGDIALGAINAGTVSARNLGTGSLSLGGAIHASGTGTSILLSTLGAFHDNAGANALDPGAGRFLVYSADPRNNTKGGIASDGHYFGMTLASNPPSGFTAGADLFLYSVVPTLTVTATGNVGYGDALSSLPLSITGFLDGDTQATALTGSVSLATGYQAGDAVGGNYAVTVGAGTLASSNGYLLNIVNGSVTVAPKVLSLSLIGASTKVYDGTNAAALASGNYQLTGLYGSDSISISKILGSFASANAGTGVSVSTTLVSGDFAAGGGTLLSNYVLPTGLLSANIGTITAKSLTLSGVSAAGRAYNGTTVIGLSGGSLSGIIGGDTVNLVAGSGNVADKNVGTNKAVTVTGYGLSGTAAGNYTLAAQPTGLTATITAKALTLSGVTASGRAYDGTDTIALSGGSLIGIVGGDTVNLVAGSGSVADKNVGINKAVTAIGFGLSGTDAANYSFTAQPTGLTATITAKALVLSGVSASGRDYDGTTAVALSGGTLTGLVGGDAVSLVSGTGSITNKNIGINKAVTATGFGITGADASNYSFSGQPTGLTVTIAAKALTLTGLTATDRAYDGTATVALSGGTLTGVIGSEQVGFTGGGAGTLADKNVGINKAVSLSGFGLNGADAGNYVLNGQPAGLTATISAKVLTLSGVSASGRAYDGTMVVALTGGTLGGVVGGDDLGLVSGTGAIADKNVGVNKAVTASGFGLSGTDAGNYAIAAQPTGLTTTITAKALTLTSVTATGRTYDGTTAVALSGGTLSGLVGGDTVGVVDGTGSIADKNVGIGKAVTATGYAISGADAGNYSLAGQPNGVTVDIAAKLLSLAGVTASDRAYDGTTLVALTGGTLTGVVGSEQVGFTTGTGTLADKNVGTGKAVSLSGFGLNGADAGNYALASQPAGLTATIVAKTLTLSGVTALDRTYDGTTLVGLSGGTLSGVVGQDAIALIGGTGSLADKNVGTNKAVTVSGFGLGGTDAANYSLAGQPGGLTATIGVRTITLTGVAALDRIYDGTTAVALSGGTLTGLVSSDAVDLVGGSGSLADKNVGAGKAVTVSGFGITGADAGNYALAGQPANLTATIGARAVTLSGVDAIDRTYDGTTSVALTQGTLTGLVAGDAIGMTSGTASMADKNAGSSKTVTVTGFGLTGADAANYSFSGQPGGITVDIATRAVTLDGLSAVNRSYDGTTSVGLSGGTLSGLVGGDAVGLVSGTASLADKNAGTAKAVTVSGFGLSGADAANYSLAGQPSGLTVTIDPAKLTASFVPGSVTKVYDGTTGVAIGSGAYSLTGLIGGDAISFNGATGTLASANAGSGVAVTSNVSAANFTAGAGTSLGNYVLPTGTITGTVETVTPAQLTIIAADATKVSGDAMPSFSFSYSGFVGSDGPAALAALPTLATTATTTSLPGSYGIKASGAQAANYTIAYVDGVLTVTPAAIPVPVVALITVNLPAPVVQPSSGFTPSEVVLSTGQSQAFVPAVPTILVSNPVTIGAAQSSLTAYDSGAQGAHTYANGFLNALQLEVQK